MLVLLVDLNHKLMRRVSAAKLTGIHLLIWPESRESLPKHARQPLESPPPIAAYARCPKSRSYTARHSKASISGKILSRNVLFSAWIFTFHVRLRVKSGSLVGAKAPWSSISPATVKIAFTT